MGAPGPPSGADAGPRSESKSHCPPPPRARPPAEPRPHTHSSPRNRAPTPVPPARDPSRPPTRPPPARAPYGRRLQAPGSGARSLGLWLRRPGRPRADPAQARPRGAVGGGAHGLGTTRPGYPGDPGRARHLRAAAHLIAHRRVRARPLGGLSRRGGARTPRVLPASSPQTSPPLHLAHARGHALAHFHAVCTKAGPVRGPPGEDPGLRRRLGSGGCWAECSRGHRSPDLGPGTAQGR